MSWTLYELSKHPDKQRKLRAEIREKMSQIKAEGRQEMTPEELESLPYLGAVVVSLGGSCR